LSKENVMQITEVHLKNFAKRVEKQGFKIEFADSIKELIVKDGYSEEFGGRPILRMITKHVQTPVSKQLLLKKFKAGDTIYVDWNTKKEEVEVTKK